MADQQDASKIFTLYVKPGIKRDGTRFEGYEYSDGMWSRFQRGRAKKIGGYRQMFASLTGVPRGIITNPINGVNYIFTGNSNGVEVFTTGTDQGVGVGPYPVEFNTTYAVTNVDTVLIQIDVVGDYTSLFVSGFVFWAYDTSGVRTDYTVDVAGSTYNSGTNRTTVTLVSVAGLPNVPTSPTTMEIYNPNGIASNANYLWQFDIGFDSTGSGRSMLLAHPGQNLHNIDSAVLTSLYAGNFLPDPTTGNYVLTQVMDSGGANPTFQPVNASGGVVVLYPYVFVYSNYGALFNNNIDFTTIANANQTLNDWNGPTANIVNVAAGKFVKGMPVRGGTAAPSGLFWATDSLVRVSFTSQTPYYWRYDIVASQISIMSSSAVTEMDGVYFWMGVDRFYLYNGSVKVLPNDKNVNYLFDNMNFSARQKVWATKVPRYNEIWFFYPRDTNTEVSDAIIYNVKDKIWYDAGSAVGARRSCGWTTEIFPTPIWAAWEYNVSYSTAYTTIATPPTLSAPAANQFYVTGNATTVLSPGSFVSFDNTSNPSETVYTIDTSSFIYSGTVPLPGVTLVTLTEDISPVEPVGSLVYGITGGYGLWQHEFGVNAVSYIAETAVTSSFTTCDISWVGGTPSQDTAQGPNRRMHIRRIEPDFVQVGEMNLTILGRKFARGAVENSGPYPFDPDTGKIDLRVEHREIRLKFESNDIDGDYQMGRLLITAEYGDERP